MEGWKELRPFDHVRMPAVSYGTPQSYVLQNYMNPHGVASFALHYTVDGYSHAPLQMYLPTHVRLQPCAPGHAVFLGGASGDERLSPIMRLPPSGWVTGKFSAQTNAWSVGLSESPNGAMVSNPVTLPAHPWDTVSFYNLPSDMKTNFLVMQQGGQADAFAHEYYSAQGMHGPAAAHFNDGRRPHAVAQARMESFGTGLHHLRGEYAHQGETNETLARTHGIDLSRYF